MKQFRKYCRKTLAGFMSVWLSGIALLLFCQTPAQAKGSDFCPLAKASKAKSHCNHSTSRNSKSDLFTQRAPESVDCCAFIPAIFDKNRKKDRHPQPVTVTEKPVQLRLKIRPARRGWQKMVQATFRASPGRIFIKHRALRI